jgi:hypothetical protein
MRSRLLANVHEANVLDFLRFEMPALRELPEMAERGFVVDGDWTDTGEAWLNAAMDRPHGLAMLRDMIEAAKQ